MLQLRFHRLGSRVAITEGWGNRQTIIIQANVIHGPAVYADGGDRFRGSFRAANQTLVNLGENAFEIPVQRVPYGDRSVAETMDQLHVRRVIPPLQQGNATALRA